MTMPTTLVSDGEKAEIKVKAAFSGYTSCFLFFFQSLYVLTSLVILQENSRDLHKL